MEQQTPSQQPVGDLVRQFSEQTSDLIRKELQLAQLEMQEKGKRAGIGAGLFGGAGVVALYGLGFVFAAIALLIATALEPWIAVLIVGVVLLAVAGVMSLLGKKQVDQIGTPAPEQAIDSAKQDVDHVKARAQGA